MPGRYLHVKLSVESSTMMKRPIRAKIASLDHAEAVAGAAEG
jgi:hypothetical protein